MQKVIVEVSSFLVEEGFRTGNKVSRSVVTKGLPEKSKLSDVSYDRNRQIIELTFDCEELDGDDRHASIELTHLNNA